MIRRKTKNDSGATILLNQNRFNQKTSIPSGNEEGDGSKNKKYAIPKFLLCLLFVTVIVIGYVKSLDQKEVNMAHAGRVLPGDAKMIVEKEEEVIIKDEREVSKGGKTTPLLDEDGNRLHIVFSTDCSDYQHWQSYLLFHSAMEVGQPGSVTRIASGCSDDEKVKTMEWHNEHIKGPMSSRFHLHLTPKFSAMGGSDFKYANKPFGLRHWLEHGDGMGVDLSTNLPLDQDGFVILIDPDMFLLRPILPKFTKETDIIFKSFDSSKYEVQHGKPFAQRYGYGSVWEQFATDEIIGETGSPAKNVKEGYKYYPAGPPYIATAKDMYSIALKWTEFCPKVYAAKPQLMAEMYAYSVAAAHLELPHQLIDSMMVSNIGGYGEGWKFIDNIPSKEVCEYASKPRHESYPVPSVVHYCQRYAVGNSVFAKRRMKTDFFTCESPLFKPPVPDLGEKYLYKFVGGKKEVLTPKDSNHHAFMVCATLSALNDAAIFFKDNHCKGVAQTNYDKNFELFL